MTNDTDATASTKPNRTDEITREIHLARLEDLWRWLRSQADKSLQVAARPPTLTVPDDVSELDRWAASVRWTIERERERS